MDTYVCVLPAILYQDLLVTALFRAWHRDVLTCVLHVGLQQLPLTCVWTPSSPKRAFDNEFVHELDTRYSQKGDYAV